MTDPTRQRIQKDILSFLRNHGDRAFRPKDIARRLNISGRHQFLLAVEMLGHLEESGQVTRLKGGRYAWRRKATRLEGILSVNRDGFGFVTPDEGADDFFVSQRRMRNAIDGDRVLVGLDAPRRGGDERRREAEVIEVLSRGRSSAVGSFRRRGKFNIVSPDDQRLPHDIYVDSEDVGAAKKGDKVVVSIDRYDDPKGTMEGRVLRVLGPETDPRVRTLAVAMSMGVDADFPEEALKEAESAAAGVRAADLTGRLDFRSETVVTIDPEDARDFDDAIHVTPRKNGTMELGVHIADVGHYVRPGSALDDAAYDRGTSVYLVDRVIPMLPERLSGDLCSLRPEEDRFCFSCIMQIAPDGTVSDYQISPSIIHSKRRLTYDQAQEILDDKSVDASAEVSDTVRRAWALAKIQIDRRMAAGSINFDLPEVRVVIDEAGHAVDIVRRERLHAHRLIEECMLLANRTVAEHMTRKHGKTPFVFRIHDHPDRERISALAEYVRAFGHELKAPDGHIEAPELNRLLDEIKGRPEEPVIEMAALRAMSKAVYSPENIGHFGLAFPDYTHFTSPIRRYPDLMVHRILRLSAAGKPGPTEDDLREACKHCSNREKTATEAERESVKLKKVEFMQQHVGDRFTGVVSGVTGFGVFVELDAVLVEGLVHVRDLADDYYEYDEATFTLSGRNTGHRYRLGDRVTVIVASASTETREIDFEFV